MSFDAQKQIRENTLELQEFLKDLKQWENRVKEKDKNTKSQTQAFVPDIPPVRGHGGVKFLGDLSQTPRAKAGAIQPEERHVDDNCKPITAAKHTYDHFRDKWDKFDVDAALREVDEDDSSSSNIYREESTKKKVDTMNGNGLVTMLKKQTSGSFVDATNEKEMGNKFFKEKKFVQAIECYSRSIALQPSAVSYANRAMACIKIRRYKEAEADCTEAIALDDRYIKAYSRRATARKELGDLLGSVSDSEFALRLEPDNKELKEQYKNSKATCEKLLKVRPEEKVSVHVDKILTHNDAKLCGKGINDSHGSMIEKEFECPPTLSEQDAKPGKVAEKSKEMFVVAQTVATSLAAGRLTTTAKTGVPKNFYEFEATWKSFSSNSAQQAELLKVINPSALPQLFKDNLSPKLLGEILQSLQHFFPDSASYAIEILENLVMAKRFNISAMCLSSTDKKDVGKLWDEVFAGSQVDEEKRKLLSQLRPKFKL